MKKTSKYFVITITSALSMAGYHSVFILAVFSLSAYIIKAEQYLFLPASNDTHSNGVYRYIQTISSLQSPDPASSAAVQAALWSVFVLVFIYATYFIGKHMSTIFRHVFRRVIAKNPGRLLVCKLAISTLAMCSIVTLSFIDKSIALVIPALLGLYAMSIACFALQHYMCARHNVPYKNVT